MNAGRPILVSEARLNMLIAELREIERLAKVAQGEYHDSEELRQIENRAKNAIALIQVVL